MKKIQFCATYKWPYPCDELLLATFLTQIKSWPSFSDPGQKKVPSLTTFLLESARRSHPTLAWLPKDLNSSDLPKHKEPTRSFHSRTVIRYHSKESHCLQVVLSTTVGLKTIWRPGACSYCRSSVVHLGLNDWWTTWQRLTASLIAAISHATANGGLNVTSLFKGPRQQTETNLKTTTTHKYVHRLFKSKSTIYWRHRACRFSTQLLLWL